MKNSLSVFLLVFALVGIFVACNETTTAGGTIDENSVAVVSDDEKAIAEHRVDSTKMFLDVKPAGINDYEIDSTRFFYDVHLSGEKEDYFVREKDDARNYCDVGIYRSEFSVRYVVNYFKNGVMIFSIRMFFLTADSDGVVYHEKVTFFSQEKALLEEMVSDLERACETDGATFYRHEVDYMLGWAYLTCSAHMGHLTESADAVLDGAAEKMKNQCLTDW